MNETKENNYEIAYTAIEAFGKKNLEDFKDELGLKEAMPSNKSMQALEKQYIWEKDGKIRKKVFKEYGDLEKNAIEFIRLRCKELRFKTDSKHVYLEDNDGHSLKQKQIPYNVMMDIDRRCLEVAIHRFMESGTTQDAFDIYYIFLEMFMGNYGKTREMIEMLSEFETNASSLLMKHRDHYSHSVYVFLIGLAYYNASENFREEYKNAYREYVKEEYENEDDKNYAAHFLKYWGFSSLFHDIGYPFELSFEQVKSYFGDTIKNVPYVVFEMNNYQLSQYEAFLKNLEEEYEKIIEEEGDIEYIKRKIEEYELNLYDDKDLQTKIRDLKEKKEKLENFESEKKKLLENHQKNIEKLKKIMPEKYHEKVKDGDINYYLACAIADIMYQSYVDNEPYRSFRKTAGINNSYIDYLYDALNKRTNPSKYGGFMDHAYFSAVMLSINLIKNMAIEDLNPMYANVLASICLHNSFYKYAVTNVKNSDYNREHHFPIQKSPLAFLLMLCDELQCWNRTSYGRNSRGEIHPMDCELKFDNDKIEAVYIFDNRYANEKKELDEKYTKAYQKNKYNKEIKGTYFKLGTKEGKEKNDFLRDIEAIISINSDNSFHYGPAKTTLEIGKDFKENIRYRRTYLSNSNFIHLYKFAYMVHQMNHADDIKIEDMEKKFNELSLEYKLSHIGRAKKFARYLDEIGCFYSDKQVDFELVESIGSDADFKDIESELNIIGALEHDRWCFEHYVMGWTCEKKDIYKENIDYRERLRVHCDMIDVSKGYNKESVIKHYKNKLSLETRKKDMRSFNNLLQLLECDDGIRVYRLRDVQTNEEDN